MLPYFFFPSITKAFHTPPFHLQLFLIPKTSISPSILNILPSPFEVSVKLCNVAAALFISRG